METINIDEIFIGERVREIDEKHRNNLIDDIKEKGLLQPIVLETRESRKLIAGAHRLSAIDELDRISMELCGEPGSYRFNGKHLSTVEIPFVVVGDLTPQQLIEYEIAENVIRKQMSWQEEARALAKLHEGMNEDTPEKPSYSKTARYMESVGDTRKPTAIISSISRATILNEQLDDPDIAGAKTMSEAWTKLRKKTKVQATSMLSEAIEKAAVESPHKLIVGDMLEELEVLRGYDTIIADPPYGVDADSWKNKFKDTPHAYKDSLDHAQMLWETILNITFHRSAERANLFMFGSGEHWNTMAGMALAAGWTVWGRPIIWKKSNEGIRPRGINGFAYTYEILLFATKGEKWLNQSINDVIEVYKVDRNERIHGAQKPVELLEKLIKISTYPGETVLDPTCGSGSIFPAANLSYVNAIGIEINPDYAKLAEARMTEGIKERMKEEVIDDNLEDL